MWSYFLRRLGYTVILLWLISVTSFIIIQLPPGDYITSYIRQLEASGQPVDQSEIEALIRQYGLDLSPVQQYFKWMGGMIRGDFGRSLQWSRPVSDLIGERMMLTVVMNLATLLFTYLTAIAIGIYSATHQYSIGDYCFTVFGFIGLAVPNFLLALILMVFFYSVFGVSIGGLFSPEYALAPWSWGKVVDLFKHLPIPIIIIGTSGTAGIIRVMRGWMNCVNNTWSQPAPRGFRNGNCCLNIRCAWQSTRSSVRWAGCCPVWSPAAPSPLLF